MTDTPLKRILHTIQCGFKTMRNTRINYTNEHWYNFKSYICGTELFTIKEFTICSHCNNYKRISNDVKCYYGKLTEQRLMCDCEILGFNNRLVDGDYELDRVFDNIGDDFTDITDDVYDIDLKRSVVF
jgi:hypothetical protein